jgi:SAM-dependent methyltransferase
VLTLGLDIGRIIAIEPGKDWWKDRIGTIPAEFRMPAVDGTIDQPDNSVDLVLAISVLHHVPNVEHVVSELGRVLKPGGRFLIRDPVFSMGDWTVPRPGATRHERGIFPETMERFIASAGLTLERRPLFASGLARSLQRKGFRVYHYRWSVALDRLVCRLPWKMSYWRTTLLEKLAPGVASYIGRKDERVAGGA